MVAEAFSSQSVIRYPTRGAQCAFAFDMITPSLARVGAVAVASLVSLTGCAPGTLGVSPQTVIATVIANIPSSPTTRTGRSTPSRSRIRRLQPHRRQRRACCALLTRMSGSNTCGAAIRQAKASTAPASRSTCSRNTGSRCRGRRASKCDRGLQSQPTFARFGRATSCSLPSGAGDLARGDLRRRWSDHPRVELGRRSGLHGSEYWRRVVRRVLRRSAAAAVDRAAIG
jgi:hypothetical protein